MAPVNPEKWRPDRVPPFPAVALKALNLIAGTDTSLLDLCNLIRPDAAFSTEVLRIANSPLVAFSKEVTNVLQASMLLGFRRLRSVVVTVGLRAYMENVFSPVLRSCWRHSVACALIAERAAGANGLDKDFAYTAGVMHDLGRVVLAASMPAEYARVAEQGADEPWGLLQPERALLGIDHCQAGGIVVKQWGLPAPFLPIASCHHDGASATGTALILSLSCLLADKLGFGVAEYRKPRNYAEILVCFPEPAGRVFPSDEVELAQDIENAIAVIESE